MLRNPKFWIQGIHGFLKAHRPPPENLGIWLFTCTWYPRNMLRVLLRAHTSNGAQWLQYGWESLERQWSDGTPWVAGIPSLYPLIEFCFEPLWRGGNKLFQNLLVSRGISVFGSREVGWQTLESRKPGILGSRLRKKSIFRFFLDCPTQPGQGRW